ncbi:MAG: succinate dehydrogenase, cytochrome b556 subunit [Anaerolineaceae bacterium]|jgi:succinate dehydrogenase / fumarate reductase cytochrome b subunit|nr:succinate dehydrogenase, cytochrome b556 subunit [Anaerolineaceae bacterium]
MENHPSRPTNLIKWFDPRHRSLGTWAFILNRLSGLGLTLYLFIHLIMLGQLAKGPEAYDGFIALVKNPVFLAGELLVVAAALIHGLNGIRIGITSFGIAGGKQKQLFIGFMTIAVIAIIYFAIRMFAH